jgi:DNA-repair protein complementing XP-A cells
LRDEEAMPHLLKANPHKSTYANMMLFLRYQVEEFAWKKWGSPETLDAEYQRREVEKKKKKNKKFEQSLKELRKRTKEGVWQRRKDEEHKHVFGKTENIKMVLGNKYVIHVALQLKWRNCDELEGSFVNGDGN